MSERRLYETTFIVNAALEDNDIIYRNESVESGHHNVVQFKK